MRIAPDARRHLADRVKRRRLELGFTHAQVAARGGPKTSVLSYLENADRDAISDRTAVSLEQALDLAPGSIEAMANGGEPTPLKPPTDGKAALSIEVSIGPWHMKVHPRPDASITEILDDLGPAVEVALRKAHEAGIG